MILKRLPLLHRLSVLIEKSDRERIYPATRTSGILSERPNLRLTVLIGGIRQDFSPTDLSPSSISLKELIVAAVLAGVATLGLRLFQNARDRRLQPFGDLEELNSLVRKRMPAARLGQIFITILRDEINRFQHQYDDFCASIYTMGEWQRNSRRRNRLISDHVRNLSEILSQFESGIEILGSLERSSLYQQMYDDSLLILQRMVYVYRKAEGRKRERDFGRLKQLHVGLQKRLDEMNVKIS